MACRSQVEQPLFKTEWRLKIISPSSSTDYPYDWNVLNDWNCPNHCVSIVPIVQPFKSFGSLQSLTYRSQDERVMGSALACVITTVSPRVKYPVSGIYWLGWMINVIPASSL